MELPKGINLMFLVLYLLGIVKDLLSMMMKNKVPGFCLEVLDSLKVMGLDEDSVELQK